MGEGQEEQVLYACETQASSRVFVAPWLPHQCEVRIAHSGPEEVVHCGISERSNDKYVANLL